MESTDSCALRASPRLPSARTVTVPTAWLWPGLRRSSCPRSGLCGDCHEEEFKAYQTTYHGQIASIGFPDVAKCSDCHGSHNIPPIHQAAVAYPEEQILETCRACHPQATAGIVSLTPHPVSEPRPLLLFGQVDQLAGWAFALLGAGFVLHVLGSVWVRVRRRRRTEARAEAKEEP